MTHVAIGIHVHAQPEQLHATLNAIRIHTTQSVELVLLPDGADQPTRAMLASLKDIRQLSTDEPRGSAACFNRLTSATDADMLVLLESGALVGPGWLDILLDAIASDPRNGLAGPSTNRSWNEQGVFRHVSGSPAAIASTAEAARRRYGATTRTLEPLYSLADFCYVVRREVVEAIGAADESYGLGPCWEMDYNIRAARAGWRGVWAGAAYVYRAPFTDRRRREEALRFEASKHRYQDRFCGLRLRGEKTTYEPHCRGEACEHFAPADRIQITLMANDGRQATDDLSTPLRTSGRSTTTIRNQGSQPPTPSPQPSTLDLVTCIMPTRNRADFVLQSITYFQRQTYADRELIIIDDGADDLEQRLPADPHIRYLRAPAGMSIGAKRNLACEHARGTIIAQWDDDDWYGPERLEQQIAPLLAGTAAITGLTTGAILDLPRWEFWRCDPALHRRLFCEDVHGGTLVYRLDVWERHARYPDRSLAEDALFLRQAIRRGMRLCRIPGDQLFVYLRHATNSWAFQCGMYLDPGGWQRIPAPPLPFADCAFYAAHSLAAPTTDRRPFDAAQDKPTTDDRRLAPDARHSAIDNASQRNLPTPNSQLPPPNLISCIMPTSNRRAFVPRAISYFLRQDYASKELIVLDDGADPVADLIPDDPRIRYVRLERRLALGAKRNRCVELAHGDLIMHWDDDDWHAPQRLSLQYAALRAAGAEICGLRQMLFFEPAARAAWLYTYPPRARPWLAGGSLLYTREFWRRAPFTNVHAGEDTRFVWEHNIAHAAIMDDYRWYVARIHPANTSPKQRAGACWRRWPGDIQSILGEDYDAFCRVQDKDGKLIDRALVQQ